MFKGLDLRTGELRNDIGTDVETHFLHHRCYRAKATDKYLLFSRTGIEFIDHAEENWICHHWVRGACLYGILPANGLIYAPQHPCACYIEAKLSGFSALAPPLKTAPSPAKPPGRLERGPAYDAPTTADSQLPTPADWPTFRHDAGRSGAASTPVEPTGRK